MSKKSALTLLLAIVSVFSCFANRPDFRIRFYNKDIYYEGSDIYLKVELFNNTNKTFYINAADERLFNIHMDVSTLQNRKLFPSEDYLIRKKQTDPSLYRIKALEPEEEMGFVIRLNDYIDIENPGLYVVESTYFPFMDIQPDTHWKSNKLTLSVRPKTESSYKDSIEQQVYEELQKRKLPPDEVVTYTLQARQENQWTKFFLYLDTESLMLQNGKSRRIYNNSTQEERFAMVDQYKEQLRGGVKDVNRDGKLDPDRAIIEIPFKYTIQKTMYDSEEAKVMVLEYFDRVSYIEKKRFTYYLRKSETFWQIYRYDAVYEGNIGKNDEDYINYE